MLINWSLSSSLSQWQADHVHDFHLDRTQSIIKLIICFWSASARLREGMVTLVNELIFILMMIWSDLEYNSDLFQTKLSVQEGQSRWSSVWGDGPLLPPGLILYLYCVAYTCLYLCLYPYNLYLCNLSLSQCVLVLLLVLIFVRLALYSTTSRSCTSLYTVHLVWR